MALDDAAALAKAKELLEGMRAERTLLDLVRQYWTGQQSLPRIMPRNAPHEVYAMARMSRVNIISLVMETLGQSLFVEGFRGKGDDVDAPVWGIWQANQFDAYQSGLTRAALAYGTSYALVLPGDPVPVIEPVSPRQMHAVYAVTDRVWPRFALQRRDDATYRLIDDTNVYTFNDLDGGAPALTIPAEAHNAGVCPVVRFRERIDLDIGDDVASAISAALETWEEPTTGLTFTRSNERRALNIGQVGPLMSLQDQVDVTTFDLLVAMHFASFKQRYIMGWAGADEEQLMKDRGLSPEAARAAAKQETLSATSSRVWLFDDPEVKVGEFSESSLEGYIKSREATLRHAASTSQTPAHELIGDLVNLSAEALAAAEAGRDRKVADRQTLFGESYEQMLGLAAKYAGIEVPVDAQVVWRDTSARSLAATVDALGKLATMLGVPAQELWERIPGVTRKDVERWKAQAATGDAFGQLTETLKGQMGPAMDAVPTPDEMKQRADAMGVLIRAGVTTESAAKLAGLDGAQFLPGATPTSLKVAADVPAGPMGPPAAGPIA
jgi:hypothetical protein